MVYYAKGKDGTYYGPYIHKPGLFYIMNYFEYLIKVYPKGKFFS